jgi:hypothetical protein
VVLRMKPLKTNPELLKALEDSKAAWAEMTEEGKTMTTAYNNMLKIDQDKMTIRKSIDLLLLLLHDFIPNSALRDAERTLYEAFEKDGIELTSRLMRKEYEAWKSTQLEALHLLPQVPRS